MYAVIATGGKQERVSEGQTLNVELLGVVDGSTVTFDTLLVVDGTKVLATPDQLKGASVTGKVIGEAKGPKINGFSYKNKSNNRKRWGHRQHYSTVEITKISVG
jgi:large subunit ribosomal protein L21